MYKRAVVFSGSRGHFKTCQCSIKTTRAFHVWQSSPSMWLQTKGNGLEQFGLIFAKKIFPPSSQTPFFGTCLFPLKMTPHCEPLFSSSLFTSRVNDVVLVSGCFDANGGCSVGGASCLMSSKCLAVAERCLVPLTGDEE